MNILIVDTETTGLDPKEGATMIEVAAILFNVDERCVLQQVSTLFPCESNPVENVNRISVSSTQKAMPCYSIPHLISDMARNSDFVIAHNADFDKQFLPFLSEYKWVCSKNDFTWPDGIGKKSASLVNISVDLGVPVVSAHRALTDCQLMASCFERIEDLKERMEEAKKGKDLYKAVVSFDDRQLAKDAGFGWNQLIPNAWARKLSEKEAAAITEFTILKVAIGNDTK